MQKTTKNFKKLKRLLESQNDYVENLEGFYFNSKAISILEKTDTSFHMNSYYDLTKYNILNMTKEANNLKDVKNNLYEEYESYYADSWYENYISVLNRLGEKQCY